MHIKPKRNNSGGDAVFSFTHLGSGKSPPTAEATDQITDCSDVITQLQYLLMQQHSKFILSSACFAWNTWNFLLSKMCHWLIKWFPAGQENLITEDYLSSLHEDTKLPLNLILDFNCVFHPNIDCSTSIHFSLTKIHRDHTFLSKDLSKPYYKTAWPSQENILMVVAL